MYDLSEVENHFSIGFLQLYDLSEVKNLQRKLIYDVINLLNYINLHILNKSRKKKQPSQRK